MGRVTLGPFCWSLRRECAQHAPRLSLWILSSGLSLPACSPWCPHPGLGHAPALGTWLGLGLPGCLPRPQAETPGPLVEVASPSPAQATLLLEPHLYLAGGRGLGHVPTDGDGAGTGAEIDSPTHLKVWQ